MAVLGMHSPLSKAAAGVLSLLACGAVTGPPCNADLRAATNVGRAAPDEAGTGTRFFENPVLSIDCPDPSVLWWSGAYHLACTSGEAPDSFPLHTSTDLVHWAPSGFIFPRTNRPSWSMRNFWAPEMHVVGSRLVAYFTANDGTRLCLGAASAEAPSGPWVDKGAPLLCDPDMGLIDPSEFEDAGGTPYLLFKTDGNAVGQPTRLYAQALGGDGMSLLGPRHLLLENEPSTWEGNIIEGPWMQRRGSDYFLFYSGNSYADARYGVGVAKSTSPTRGFVKLGQPILHSNRAGGTWIGPGHNSLAAIGATTFIVYHAYDQADLLGGRQVLIDPLDWTSGWPRVSGDSPSLGRVAIPEAQASEPPRL